MVRVSGTRVDTAMIAAGVVILSLQVLGAALFGLSGPSLPGVAPTRTPAVTRPSEVGADVFVIWREFRQGQREAGTSATSVGLCAAALQGGGERTAVVVRFCNAQPITPQRRFAFGYDDLRIRAVLPGGAVLAYDLLDYEPISTGGARFRESPLPDNTANITAVGVRNITDIVFIVSARVPLGLPTVELSARYAGADIRERHTFEPLGADLAASEGNRRPFAPDWARTRY